MRIIGAFLAFFLAFTASYKFDSQFIAYKCNPRLRPGECRWSEYSKCIMPISDNAINQMTEVLDELEDSKGCQSTNNVLREVVIAYIVNQVKRSFVGGPLQTRLALLEKMPGGTCGGCGLKFRCCNKAKNFNDQALGGSACSDSENATLSCKYEPLSQTEKDTYKAKNPAKVVLNEPCNFDQFIDDEYIHNKSMSGEKDLFKTAYCTIFGMLRPSMRCAESPDKKKCFCCCYQFLPNAQGECIKDPNFVEDSECARDQNETNTCQRKDKSREKLDDRNENLRNRFRQFISDRRTTVNT